MATQSPITPIKANHRFIQRCVQTVCGGKVEEKPDEFDMINSYFLKLGGSWEKIFKGDPSHIVLLKKIIKIMYKNNKLTLKADWN